MYLEIYFKKLAHVITGASKSEIHRAGRPETQAGVDVTVLRENFFFSGKLQFLLLSPPTDCMSTPCHY